MSAVPAGGGVVPTPPDPPDVSREFIEAERLRWAVALLVVVVIVTLVLVAG
jgi:hypothetical protein